MEFKNESDIHISEKMLKFPLLGEDVNGWKVSFTAEFHMTNDSGLFHRKPDAGRLPLFEGKMIWQFDHQLSMPRYWVSERDGRQALIGRKTDQRQKMDYQTYRLGF